MSGPCERIYGWRGCASAFKQTEVLRYRDVCLTERSLSMAEENAEVVSEREEFTGGKYL